MKPNDSRRMRRYRLIEYFANGCVACEDFPAPSDEEAVRRALDVCTAAEVEIWRNRVLIGHVSRDGAPPATRGHAARPSPLIH